MDPDDKTSNKRNRTESDRTSGDKRGEEKSSEITGDEELIVAEDTSAWDAAASETADTLTSELELVALYGLSARYPKSARLEFNPKSNRDKGDVAFHIDKNMKIFLSWGNLEEARKRYATASAQASGSIKNALKSSRGKLDGSPETKTLNILGHDAVYTHVRMYVEQSGMLTGTRRVTHDAYSLHLQCDHSGRYYVVYAFSRPDETERMSKLFEPIMSSLKCH